MTTIGEDSGGTILMQQMVVAKNFFTTAAEEMRIDFIVYINAEKFVENA